VLPLLLLFVDQKFGLMCTITFAICFRYVPPAGLGMIPLFVTLQLPVATIATLFFVHALDNTPRVFFSVLVSSLAFKFVSLTMNLVRSRIANSLMS
jgi:hypothetical protein